MHHTTLFSLATATLLIDHAKSLPSPALTPELASRTSLTNETADCVSNGYATFFDDNNCQTNPTVAFSLGNPSCLVNMYNKNSIFVQQSCWDDYFMVWSPLGTCNCQVNCALVLNHGCWDLNGNPGATSFRFQAQACGADNC